ncbi:MAG: hypothetical protein H0T39_00320 [Actinobacteria bacterium]|nr:hypothetical protein [Actinomycetota bacterium]
MRRVEDRDAKQAVAAASSHRFHGTVWRVHWKDVAPTDWRLSLRTTGRYHRGLDLFPADQAFLALYTSLAPEIAIWEMVRQSTARNLAYLQNNVLTELEVSLERMLDLSHPAAIGLADSDLIGDDLQLCEKLAAVARDRGHEGLPVPSAALPGLNLVFMPRDHTADVQFRVVRSRDLPLDTITREHPDDARRQDR